MDFKKYITEAAKQKHAFVVSGRYNPPTIGHMHLFKQAHEAAQAAGGDLHVVASHSEGTSKNPLPQDKKMEYLRKVLPKGTTVSGTSSQAPSIFHTLSHLHKQGYTHVTMVSDAPRTEQYRQQVPKYNNVEGKHGHYNFKKINFISAGERNPDDDTGIQGVSATKAREHALAGRMDEFKKMLPKELHPHAEEMANHIKLANEDYENPYRFDDGTPEGTEYMRKMTPGENKSKQLTVSSKKMRKEQTIPMLFKNYNEIREQSRYGELADLNIPEPSETSDSYVQKTDIVKNTKDEIHRTAADRSKKLMQFKQYVESVEEAVWDQAKERQDLPKEKLSAASKAKAKARAKAAGRPYPNMVDNIWAARQQESVVVEEKEEEDDEELKDEDISKMVDKLDWEDINDLYDDDEFEDEDDEEDEEDDKESKVNEAISVQSRLKKRQAFARSKSKRGTAKRMKLRRASDMATLQKRAKLAARRALYKRFLRGRDKSQLSAGEKDRIESQISKLKTIQTTIAQRMMPKIRQIEQKRLSKYRTGK